MGVTLHSSGEVDVFRVHALAHAIRRVGVADEVQLLLLTQPEPGAPEGEWRPRNLLQAENLLVKANRALEVTDGETDMVQKLYVHNLFGGKAIFMVRRLCARPTPDWQKQ